MHNPVVGIGAEGNLLANVLVNAGAPTAGPAIRDVGMAKVLSLQLITRSFTGAFTGNWLIEVSNNYTPAGGTAAYGQPTNNAGDWTDVTAQFASNLLTSTAITAAITANGSQIVHWPQANVGFRSIRVSVTRTGGTSVIVDAWLVAKR